MPLKSPLFMRQTEDFDCDNCGMHVQGNGYTNHCPRCLCSKHVDINPGDRASTCHGLMYPVSYEQKNRAEYIVQECVKCHHVRRNKVSPDDSRDAVIALSSGRYSVYLEKLKTLFKKNAE